MSDYIDGFVIPLSKDKIEDYLRVAKIASEVWMSHGALEYRECVGEDLHIKDMTTSFPGIAGASEGETVIFAYIRYKSREHRDEVNAAVMADPRMTDIGPDACPIDCKRMAYGGFQTIVEA